MTTWNATSAVGCWLLMVAPFWISAGESHAAAEVSGVVAFENVSVVGTRPGQKRLRRKQTVVVEDGVIVSVGKSKRVEIPEGATVVDGRKRFLVPGLADMHVHLDFLESLPEEMKIDDAYSILLANGVTTVLDMTGTDRHLTWRRQLERGKAVGPRLFFTSPQIKSSTVSDPGEAEARVREWAAKGYDAVKVHTPVTEPVFRRVVEVADELGIPVYGHAARPGIDFATSLEGLAMIAHAEELLWVEDPESFDDLEGAIEAVPGNVAALAESGVWLTGTVVVEDVFTRTAGDDTFAEQLASPNLRYFPHSLRDSWQNANPVREQGVSVEVHERVRASHLATIAETRRLGAIDRLLLGSDGGGPPLVLLGFSAIDELELLVEAGLSPREALRAGSWAPAEFLGLTEFAGSVDVGKHADLILASGNPLKRISKLRRPEGVMVRGVWLSRDELDARLADLARRFESRPAAEVVR